MTARRGRATLAAALGVGRRSRPIPTSSRRTRAIKRRSRRPASPTALVRARSRRARRHDARASRTSAASRSSRAPPAPASPAARTPSTAASSCRSRRSTGSSRIDDGDPHRGRRAGRAQRDARAEAAARGLYLRARSGEPRDLHDRRQHRDQRRRLPAASSTASPAITSPRSTVVLADGTLDPHRRAHHEERRRPRPHAAHGRLRGNARRHRRGDACASCARRVHPARWSRSSTRSSARREAIVAMDARRRSLAPRGDGSHDGERGRELTHMDLDTTPRRSCSCRATRPTQRRSSRSARRSASGVRRRSVLRTDDLEEGRLLLAARRMALPALERKGTTLLDDVAVPRPAIPDDDRAHRARSPSDTGSSSARSATPATATCTRRSCSTAPTRDVHARGLRRVRRDRARGDRARRHDHRRARRGLAQARLPGSDGRRGRARADARIKAAFDPPGILNPGKAI